MADFEPINIGELPLVPILKRDDLLMVNVLSEDKIIRVKDFIDVFQDFDYDFTGDVTFIGTIGPPIDGDLSAVFNNLTVKGNLFFGDNVKIENLKLNSLEDVLIQNPIKEQILIYDINPLTGDAFFRNFYVNDFFLDNDDPNDGQVYARFNGGWRNITSCLRGPCDPTPEPTPEPEPDIPIGEVTLKRISTTPLLIEVPHTFQAITSGTPREPFYEWSISPNTAVIVADSDNKALVTFGEPGNYTLSVKVTSFYADDSPVTSTASAFVGTQIGNVIITPEKSSIVTGEDVDFVASVTGDDTDISYKWFVTPATPKVTIKTFDTATINFSDPGEYNVSCESSSPNSYNGPALGNIKITVDPATVYKIGDVTISSSTDDIAVGDTVSYSASISGNAQPSYYNWTISPSGHQITNNGTTANIKHTSTGNFSVNCEVYASNAVDSPSTGSYGVNIRAATRLFFDIEGSVGMLDEGGDNLNYN